ncbi:MAG: 2-oxoacid:acceptor oxidoreductase subunit alpha [Patescibacteria group bacterium]|nr:2-oxoacid:acceptor oxidoreductase subunit alpha [Patescibacteria group bacterium]
MLDKKIFSLKIGGQAGQGVKSVGLMLAKVASRSGFHIYDCTEYPSLIRGGHNVMQICFSAEEITAPIRRLDFLIALNQQTIDLHRDELVLGSGILFDSKGSLDLSVVGQGINQFPMPLSQLANEAGGKELLSNIVAIGGSLALLGGNLAILKDLISAEFGDKGEEIVRINHQAAELGFNYARENFADKLQQVMAPFSSIETNMIVNGNEAAALGAIAGGVQFAAIYPMTPITSIINVLAANQEKYGFIFKQPEDEIAAINMAIGASVAGARSMVATSGGGFCLMTEGYGLAGIMETPVVIVEGMRPGPATGVPTWSEQGDLQFVLHAHQGDFPRIVLAAGDAKEAFFLTMEAFNLADKYQTPVVVIVDKNICENDQSFPLFDLSSYQQFRGKLTGEKLVDYRRYEDQADGISMRTLPGSGNFFIASSYEHDSQGLTTEDEKERVVQMKKRMTKLETCAHEDMPSPQLFGPEEARVTFVSWGSNKGSILQAMKDFPDVNFLHLTWMNPFPSEVVKTILQKASYLVGVECNYSGQLMDLIREKTGIEILDKMLKYDGRPFYPEEIAEKIESILK